MLASSGRHGGIYFYQIEPNKIKKVFERNEFDKNGKAVSFRGCMDNDGDKLIAGGGDQNRIIGKDVEI